MLSVVRYNGCLFTVMVLSLAFANAAPAFECVAIAGTSSTAPDDGGVDDRTACGDGAVASNNSAIALGANATASGGGSTAMGQGADAGGGGSIALGFIAEASGALSIAVGDDALASENFSTAVGSFATATEAFNTTLGYDATALTPNTNATALGAHARVGRSNAMVLGSIPGVGLAADYVDVAIDTTTPAAPLHIARGLGSSPGNAQVLVDNIDQPTAAPRSMLELINNGPIGFNMENVDTGQRWRFAAQTTGFRVSLAGTGGPELEVRENGNAVLAGNLFTNSDVNAKQDIVPVAGVSVLEKLERLPVSEWSYRDATDTRHLGPMAQDFHAAFGLGPNDTSIAPMDLAGVGLAAVKALHAELREKQAEVDALRAELRANQTQTAALAGRLEALETTVQMAGFGRQRIRQYAGR